MAKINVNGVDIHYQRYGQGPDIVMLHGLAANLAFWHRRIVPLLAADYRVTVFDLRGHGHSGMPDTGYTTRDMAGDLHGVIEKTGLEKVHLVGHSMGGAVCIQYAVMHPERVWSLTMVDSRLHSLQPLRKPEESAYWEMRRAELRDKGIEIPDDTPKVVYMMLEELMPLVKAGVANPNAIPGLIVSKGVWNPKSRAALRWKGLVSGTTFSKDIRKVAGLTRKRISEIVIPTLLTYGGDSFCLETCRGLEALLPDCRTIIHEGMGHFYPAVAPEMVVADVREFISAITHAQRHLDNHACFGKSVEQR